MQLSNFHEEITKLRMEGVSYRNISIKLFGKYSLHASIRRYCLRHDICTDIDIKNLQDDGVTMPPSTSVKRLPKVLIIDIETSLCVSFHFGMFKQFIQPKQVIKQPCILTISYKWFGDTEKTSLKLTDYDNAINRNSDSKYLKVELNDKNLVQDVWHILNEADIVVAHNGKKFDNGWLRQQFLKHGLPMPAPYKIVDTLQVIKRELNLPRNSLEAVAEYFNLPIKKQDVGMDLWISCMYGDEKAFDTMSEYNDYDIDTLEWLYLLVRAIDSTHPNMAILTNSSYSCTHCGNDRNNISIDKKYYTSANLYDMYFCPNCGGYFRDRKHSNKKVVFNSRNL